MSRPITVEGVARAVRYLDRAFWRYSNEAIAAALKTAGIDANTAGFVGTFLDDIAQMKLLPEQPEPKCAECGGDGGKFDGHIRNDLGYRANTVYCSNKCRQTAYRKRKAARCGKVARSERTTVTKSKSVTEAPLEKAAQP
jgi:hypothetical protein